jgi:hypothetical protein
VAFRYETPVLENNLFSREWQRMLSALFFGSFADNETPTGVIDGANKVFSLAKTPSPSANLQLFKNGILQVEGTDYTLAKNVVTFGAAPALASTLKAFYRY